MAELLARSEWEPLAAAHTERAHELLDAVLARKSQAARHPIEDFLFDYYRLRPGQMMTWHPGVGVHLADAPEYAEHRFYTVVDGVASLDVDEFWAHRSNTVRKVISLESAITTNREFHGCFGMHEWAMVYGLTEDQTRHPQLHLRFDRQRIMEIVDEVGMRCSHYDAFRFFTPAACPLNALQPTREDQPRLDQAGCLHANMDLYKWAGKLSPAIGSSLLMATFELARDIRVMDMAASPYDVRHLGHEPVQVETAEGRAEYVRAQRGFTERARVLRAELLDNCRLIADAVGADKGE